ncbi:retrotransposon-related protein [Cinnamomum micranthum f. kanehirae]|uniref:Retrotransposon-related protein n=1 Tax=Cinnamomum micranthum f. kanehirae TaxID=337451 RepID=A0A443N309_9MAGN|nr:retrotransposon-related protein [Cinnamomum micranthum f. kanehirae]
MIMIDGWMAGIIDRGEGDEEDDNLEYTHHMIDREEEEEKEEEGFHRLEGGLQTMVNPSLLIGGCLPNVPLELDKNPSWVGMLNRVLGSSRPNTHPLIHFSYKKPCTKKKTDGRPEGKNGGATMSDAAKEYAAGLAAGVATVVIGHPFDTVKVKLQKHNTEAHGVKYKNALHCTARILSSEGVDFVVASEVWFGTSEYDDPTAALAKLKQNPPVQDYQTQFEALANRTENLNESFMISCFVGGLKEDMKLNAQMFRPTSLSAAIGLARLQEEKLMAKHRRHRLDNTKTTQVVGSSTGKTPIPPIKKLTPAETKERHDQGLCYNCDEKFSPGHHCKL